MVASHFIWDKLDNVNAVFDRMRAMVADQEAANTVRPQRLPIDPSDQRVRPDVVRPERVALERFDVEGLTVSYGARRVLEDVSFSVGRGDFVVITGPVGAGKSSLLRALLGLAFFCGVGWLLSSDKKPINLRVVVGGILL